MSQERKINRQARAERRLRRNGRAPAGPELREFQFGDVTVSAVDSVTAGKFAELIAAHCEECAAAMRAGTSHPHHADGGGLH